MATMNMYRYRYSPANVVLTMDEETYEFVDGAFTYCNIIHDYTGTITGKPRRLPLIQCAMEMELKHIAILYLGD